MIFKMANEISLNNGGVYHFTYQANLEKHPYILEELIEQIATHLKGQTFIKEQLAELVVVAYDFNSRVYILNKPKPWVLKDFQRECGVKCCQKRIGNDKIREIIVHNMRLPFSKSEILTADIFSPTTSRFGYCTLMPHYLDLNTQDLGALLDELMNLHLFRIRKSARLSWLRKQYQ